VLQPDVVWVECHGETPPDRENVGPMVYFPLPGFRGVYFPFTGIEGYLSPLVAVHFKKPTRGVLIKVECKAWAKNIDHGGEEKVGIVKFELWVD
jgi:sodium/potassium-transporting ATPase subunit beta